jgi:hypothetical protein
VDRICVVELEVNAQMTRLDRDEMMAECYAKGSDVKCRLVEREEFLPESTPGVLRTTLTCDNILT